MFDLMSSNLKLTAAGYSFDAIYLLITNDEKCVHHVINHVTAYVILAARVRARDRHCMQIVHDKVALIPR